MNVYPIVTVCGSMRNYSRMLEHAARLTAEGVIVILPHSVVRVEDQSSEFKLMLDLMHRAKIDMADEIHVVTAEDGYYGESTTKEIEYAATHNKQVAHVVIYDE